MAVTTLGIDLAKLSFALHGIDQQGSVLIKKNVRRANLAKMISKLEPCLIGMEACSGAHYWARLFIKMGHSVKLMPPQFVKPYVKSNKNDVFHLGITKLKVQYVKFNGFIKLGNWADAAKQSNRLGISPLRNKYVYELLNSKQNLKVKIS